MCNELELSLTTPDCDGCRQGIERLKAATLPSRRRFRARIAQCNTTLAACVGPAATDFHNRLELAATRGAVEYGEHFLARLSQLLLLACIGGVLAFRYVCVSSLGELICWLLLALSEVVPRLNVVANFSPLGSEKHTQASFWETPSGSMLLEAYEVMVFNEYMDAEDWIQIILVAAATACFARKCYRCCRSCCGWDTPRRRRHHLRREMARRSRRTPRRRHSSSGASCRHDDYAISDDDDDYDDGWDDGEESSRAPLRRPDRGRHGDGCGGASAQTHTNFC